MNKIHWTQHCKFFSLKSLSDYLICWSFAFSHSSPARVSSFISKSYMWEAKWGNRSYALIIKSFQAKNSEFMGPSFWWSHKRWSKLPLYETNLALGQLGFLYNICLSKTLLQASQTWRCNRPEVRLTHLKPIKDPGQWAGSAAYQIVIQITGI